VPKKGVEENMCVEVREAEKLISEGNIRLQKAIKHRLMDDVSAAQALIEAGTKRLQRCRKSNMCTSVLQFIIVPLKCKSKNV